MNYKIELSLAISHNGKRFTQAVPGGKPFQTEGKTTFEFEATDENEAAQKLTLSAMAVLAAAQVGDNGAAFIKAYKQMIHNTVRKMETIK